MDFTVLTKEFAQAKFKLFLTTDKDGPFFLCKPFPDSVQREVSAKVVAEFGMEPALAGPAFLKASLRKVIIGWEKLVDPNGEKVPFSTEMLDELCETDPVLMREQFERVQRIAREGRLVQEKN